MLQNYEDRQAETPTIILDIPGTQAKEHHTDEELRSLTLEAPSFAYPSTTWGRTYTDRSAEEAAPKKKKKKNGGGGVFIKLPDGRSIRKSVATRQQSTNYRAEAYALLATAQTLNQEERLSPNTVFVVFFLGGGGCFVCLVFFTDCRSILQSLQSPGGEQSFSNIRQELSLLKEQNICEPPVNPFWLWCWRQWGRRPAIKNDKQVGAICTTHVLQQSKDHPKKQLQDGVATTPRHWDRRGQHPPTGQSSLSHNL